MHQESTRGRVRRYSQMRQACRAKTFSPSLRFTVAGRDGVEDLVAFVVAGTVAGGTEHAGVIHAACTAAVDDLTPLKDVPADLPGPDGAAAGTAVAGQWHGRLHREVHGDARHQLGLCREPAVIVLHEAAPEPGRQVERSRGPGSGSVPPRERRECQLTQPYRRSSSQTAAGWPARCKRA